MATNDRISQLVRIFDQLPDEQADALLKKLLKEDLFAAIKIIQRHFGFPDLLHANDAGLDELLASLPETTFHTALHGGPDALIKRFPLRMGTGKARTFIQDVDEANVPVERTESAKRAILVKAMMLHRRGLLSMERPGIDDR